MPLFQVEGSGGCLTPENKSKLSAMAMYAVRIGEGEWLRKRTWVTNEDVASGARGAGSRPVPTGALKSRAKR